VLSLLTITSAVVHFCGMARSSVNFVKFIIAIALDTAVFVSSAQTQSLADSTALRLVAEGNPGWRKMN